MAFGRATVAAVVLVVEVATLDTPLDTPLESPTEAPVVDETPVNADVAVLMVPDGAVPTLDDVAKEAVLAFPVAEKLADAAAALLLPWSATSADSAPWVSSGPLEPQDTYPMPSLCWFQLHSPRRSMTVKNLM